VETQLLPREPGAIHESFLDDPLTPKCLQLLCALLLVVGMSSACVANSGKSCDNATTRLTNQAQQLFDSKGLRGALVMQPIESGPAVALNGSTRILPLSTTKLLLYAIYLEHHDELRTVDVDASALVARGVDNAGRKLAFELRAALGSETIAHDLAQLGFPPCSESVALNCTNLSATTPDGAWSEALSLGEEDFQVTPLGLAKFLRVIADSRSSEGTRVLSESASHAMQSAMLDTVTFGTARGVQARLGSLGYLGGKTGTGPGKANPYDGIFAGLAFDTNRQPRFAVVTYVRAGGPGGGIAAEISADLARSGLEQLPACSRGDPE
jgi:hypothetical protein